MDEKYLKDYKALEAKLFEQGDYDLEKIERAFEICTEAHKGQYRFSHEEYYVHPLAVAEILIKMGMDSESIIAALLHELLRVLMLPTGMLKKNLAAVLPIWSRV